MREIVRGGARIGGRERTWGDESEAKKLLSKQPFGLE